MLNKTDRGYGNNTNIVYEYTKRRLLNISEPFSSFEFESGAIKMS